MDTDSVVVGRAEGDRAYAKPVAGEQVQMPGREGRTHSSKGNAPKQKGQVKDGKSVQYTIKDRGGRTKYIGTTNNPTRRASEHRETGKLGRGDKLVVETKPIPREVAERVEAAKLNSHRRTHGRNPRHNITSDGKYHQPPLF